MNESVLSSQIASDYYYNKIKEVELNGKIVAQHFGEFSYMFSEKLIERIGKFLVSAGEKKSIIKRVFSISTEGINSLRKHGELDGNGLQIGYLIVVSEEAGYRFIVGNLILNENRGKLEGFLRKINSFSVEELIRKKNEAIENEYTSDPSGAGLGFIITRLSSNNEIEFSFEKINEIQDLFSVNVFVSNSL